MTKQTYLNSIDILLDAYNNGTLFHGSCSKCAVGNILRTSIWQYDFCTESFRGIQKTIMNYIPWELDDALEIHSGCYPSKEQLQMAREYLDNLYAQHGFTKDELAQIEYAFETSIHNTEEGYEYYVDIDKKKGQFIGLTSVLALMETMVEEEVTSQQPRLEKIAKEKYSVTI